ncbi:MAG: metallophosphatase [Prolixibacteraceae bacterium]|nr:metallophosphatase [Prolixibacteraceae bacterium]
MNRRIFIKNLSAGAAGILTGAYTPEAFAGNTLKKITLLHTNDLHSQIEPFDAGNTAYAGRGGFARIAHYVKKCRKENPHLLLFDGGDSFQGTPYFNFFGGEFIFKMMHEIGYDAGTLGNHEFDSGTQGLYDPVRMANFPIINSNYDLSDTILSGMIPRYKIFKKNGIRIGVYGLGISLVGLVNEKNCQGVKYLDPVGVAQEMESFLALEKKCDLVVCLSHIGLQYREDRISDVTLAPETSYTDVIIGGHTHTYLEEPLQLTNKQGNAIIVNQAHWGGLVVGHLDFYFEKGKRQKHIATNIQTS